MSAQRCRECGAAIIVHEGGDLLCLNGHTQPEVVGGLLKAMAELVAGPLRELRATLEEQGVELQSLREAVEALRAERSAPEVGWVDLATEARRLGRSRDWMYRHARELGGKQDKAKARWRFDPATTDAKLGALDGVSCLPAPRAARPGRPRQLPGSVPLLPVKERAA